MLKHLGFKSQLYRLRLHDFGQGTPPLCFPISETVMEMLLLYQVPGRNKYDSAQRAFSQSLGETERALNASYPLSPP